MVTVLHAGGYNFMIFSNDHAPAHVHVWARGKRAKLLLEPVSVVKANGFNRGEMSRIIDLTVEHRELLLEAWDKQFPAR